MRVRAPGPCVLCAGVLSTLAPLVAQDWPAWRGPRGDGSSPATAVPLEWGTKSNVVWKVKLPRPANGSAIVSKGRVFVAGSEDAKGKVRTLHCFDRKNGKELWVRRVAIDKAMPTHRTNPYGGSTPAADGKRVVVWHASAGLHCYDFAGELQWKHDFGEFRHRWGYGTSPVIHSGRVVLHSGPGKSVFVACFELESGKRRWRRDEPVEGNGEDNDEKRLMGSWCTPLIVDRGERKVVICAHSTRVAAYDFESGETLWTCEGLRCKRGDLVYSSPVVAGELCVVTGGYDGPEFAVRFGGKGEVSDERRVWRHLRRPSNCGSGVHIDGHLYIPDINGTLRCVDVKTGDIKWRKRAARGGIWSSIVHVDGRLYTTNLEGTTIVFAPNPEDLQVLAKNELGERCCATPAFSDGQVFLRTHEHLWCFGSQASADQREPGPPRKSRPAKGERKGRDGK